MSTKRSIDDQGWIQEKRPRTTEYIECYLPGLGAKVRFDRSRVMCIRCNEQLTPDALTLTGCAHSVCRRCYIGMIVRNNVVRCECGATSNNSQTGLSEDLKVTVGQFTDKLKCGAIVTGLAMREDHVSCCSECMLQKTQLDLDMATKISDKLSEALNTARSVSVRQLAQEREQIDRLKLALNAADEREAHWRREFHTLHRHLENGSNEPPCADTHESAGEAHAETDDDTHVSETDDESDEESENAQLC